MTVGRSARGKYDACNDGGWVEMWMCVHEYVDVGGLVDGCVDVDVGVNANVNVEQCGRLHVHLHERL